MPELSPPYDQMTTEELLALFQGPPRPTPEQIAAENELIASYTAYVDAKPEPLSQPTPTSPVNTPDALTASAPFPFLDSSHRRILPSPKNSSHLLNSTDHLEARPESGPSTSGISLNASVAIQQGGVPERVVDWGEAGGHEGGQQKVIKREEGGQSRVDKVDDVLKTNGNHDLRVGLDLTQTTLQSSPHAPYQPNAIPVIDRLAGKSGGGWFTAPTNLNNNNNTSLQPVPVHHAASLDQPIKDVLLALNFFADAERRDLIEDVVLQFNSLGFSPKHLWELGEEKAELAVGQNGLVTSLISQVVMAIGVSEGYTEERMIAEGKIPEDKVSPAYTRNGKQNWKRAEDSAYEEFYIKKIKFIKDYKTPLEFWTKFALEFAKLQVSPVFRTGGACPSRARTVKLYKNEANRKWQKVEGEKFEEHYLKIIKSIKEYETVEDFWDDVSFQSAKLDCSPVFRTGYACKFRARDVKLYNNEASKKWDAEEDAKLETQYQLVGKQKITKDKEFWDAVAAAVDDRSARGCKHRAGVLKLAEKYPAARKKHSQWSKEEDEIALPLFRREGRREGRRRATFGL